MCSYQFQRVALDIHFERAITELKSQDDRYHFSSFKHEHNRFEDHNMAEFHIPFSRLLITTPNPNPTRAAIPSKLMSV
jgi:hypothetical protein